MKNWQPSNACLDKLFPFGPFGKKKYFSLFTLHARAMNTKQHKSCWKIGRNFNQVFSTKNLRFCDRFATIQIEDFGQCYDRKMFLKRIFLPCLEKNLLDNNKCWRFSSRDSEKKNNVLVHKILTYAPSSFWCYFSSTDSLEAMPERRCGNEDLSFIAQEAYGKI